MKLREAGKVGVSDPQFLEELKSYVGFGPAHAAVLVALREPLAPALPSVVERFYEAIMRTPSAMAVFTGGLPQIERQKRLLHSWLQGLFCGVYDRDYLELRARIGRTHVRIRLDQRYMFTAMNLVREGLHRALDALPADTAQLTTSQRSLAHEALDKLCDIELAIMVQTYSEDSAIRLRDNERLAALGQLSGFVGHELRNPLAVMETSLHLLKKRLPQDDEHVQRHVRRLGEQLTISTDIISALLELARDKPVERVAVQLAPAIQAVLDSLHGLDDIAVDIAIPSELPAALLDEKQVRHLISNLVVNAEQALSSTQPSRKQIRVSAQRMADSLVLAVDDSGPGIPDEVRHRLFEPLATTRVKGLGLGLALCRRVAEKHGGHIRALKSALGGARFEASFPHAFAEPMP